MKASSATGKPALRIKDTVKDTRSHYCKLAHVYLSSNVLDLDAAGILVLQYDLAQEIALGDNAEHLPPKHKKKPARLVLGPMSFVVRVLSEPYFVLMHNYSAPNTNRASLAEKTIMSLSLPRTCMPEGLAVQRRAHAAMHTHARASSTPVSNQQYSAHCRAHAYMLARASHVLGQQ